MVLRFCSALWADIRWRRVYAPGGRLDRSLYRSCGRCVRLAKEQDLQATLLATRSRSKGSMGLAQPPCAGPGFPGLGAPMLAKIQRLRCSNCQSEIPTPVRLLGWGDSQVSCPVCNSRLRVAYSPTRILLGTLAYVVVAFVIEFVIDPVARFPSVFESSPLVSVVWSFAIFLLLVGPTAKYFLRYISRLELVDRRDRSD